MTNNFKFDPANTYSILYNLINSYSKISDIKRAYKSKFPVIIAFDLDQTMLAVQFHNNKKSTYHIYPETFEVMAEVQLVRAQYFPENPTYIAVTSRHYSPKSLLDLLQMKQYDGRPNPLYYENFDYIISRYTGPASKIRKDVSAISDFFKYNGYPSDGFIFDVAAKDYGTIADDNTNFPDLDKISKYGHFHVLKRRYNVEYEDILTFDDDEKYFTEKGLGPAKDVYTAGVLRSNQKDEQGIRQTLFRTGIAHYVFDKIKKNNQNQN